MRKEYNKLVRDRIPEIIRVNGQTCATEVMSEAEYLASLKEKLVEEAQEAGSADPAELAAELGDILEVIDALVAAARIDLADIQRQQSRKRAERGGFEQRIRLVWTEGECGRPREGPGPSSPT